MREQKRNDPGNGKRDHIQKGEFTHRIPLDNNTQRRIHRNYCAYIYCDHVHPRNNLHLIFQSRAISLLA